MELSMSSSELRIGIERVKGVVDAKAGQPILANVLISAKDGEVSLTGFNGFQLCVSSHPAEIVKAGSVAVPARMFFDMVRSLPEAKVTLTETDRHYVLIGSGKAKFKLVGEDVSLYPEIKQMTDLPPMTKFDGAAFLAMVKAVEFAIAPEENRPALRGALLEVAAKGRTRMTATDGRQLATTEQKLGAGFKFPGKETGVTLSSRGLAEVKRLIGEAPEAEMELGFGERMWRWVKPGVSVVSGYQEDKFPDWKQVVSENATVAVVDRPRLIEVLKRVSLVTASRGYEVQVDLQKGALSVKANSAEYGEADEEIEVNYSGEPYSNRFPADRLLSALAQFSDDMIRLTVGKAEDPMIFVPVADKNYLTLVMSYR